MNQLVPAADVIDIAFLDIIHNALGDDLPEEDLDGAADVLFQVIDDMIIDKNMPETPEIEDSDEYKNKWLQDNIQNIKNSFCEYISLDGSEEQHDQHL